MPGSSASCFASALGCSFKSTQKYSVMDGQLLHWRSGHAFQPGGAMGSVPDDLNQSSVGAQAPASRRLLVRRGFATAIGNTKHYGVTQLLLAVASFKLSRQSGCRGQSLDKRV